MGVFVDPGYKTGLGTGFYDRLRELEELDRYTGRYRVTLVYGPRNAGKSELVRYWASRRAGGGFAAFRADRLRVGEAVEGLDGLLEAPSERLRGLLASALERLAGERLGLLGLVAAVYEALAALGGVRVVLIDEFHMLPKYTTAGRREALEDLEALAHRLAKDPSGRVRVVLTVSEGFAATGGALARLHGYGVKLMLVEGLDPDHYSALYEEYEGLRGCAVGQRLLYGVAGGAPGYLPLLCQGEDLIVDFVEDSKRALEAGLARVREELARGPGEAAGALEPRKLLLLTLRLAGGAAVRPLEDPGLYRLGEMLTEHNIVYPSYEGDAVRFKPQLPLYRVLLEIAVERGYTSILEVDALEALERAARSGDRPRVAGPSSPG